MKTYLLNIPNEIKNWNNSLNAKTILSTRSWLVFNDEGIKEVYIFQKDGTLVASQNGKVTKAKWEYIAINSSIVIEVPNGETYMLNPNYYDEKVLALQIDGTNTYSVMIDQGYVEQLMLDTVNKVNMYITDNAKFEEDLNAEKRRLQEIEENKRRRWDNFIEKKLAAVLREPEFQKEMKRIKTKRYLSLSIGIISIVLISLCVSTFKESSGLILAVPFLLIIIVLSVIIFSVYDVETYKADKLQQLRMEYPYNQFNGDIQ